MIAKRNPPQICKISKSSTSQGLRQYTSNQHRKIERCQHVAGWTWKHQDLYQLCPKFCNKTNTKCQANPRRFQPFITWSATFTLSKFRFESLGLARVLSDRDPFGGGGNEHGELTSSHRWTGCIWEITSSNCNTPDKLSSTWKEFRQYTWLSLCLVYRHFRWCALRTGWSQRARLPSCGQQLA